MAEPSSDRNGAASSGYTDGSYTGTSGAFYDRTSRGNVDAHVEPSIERYGGGSGSGTMNSVPSQPTELDRRPLIRRPGYDIDFDCNTNTLNGYHIHDVYHVNLDGEPLAGGGFGSVFKGQHLFMEDMPVAVKEISFEISHNRALDHETLVRGMDAKVAEVAILKEFRNCSDMVHLHEYFVSAVNQGSRLYNLYIVTEFLAGGELFECIVQRYKQQRRNAFTEADVREVFQVLLEAVKFMHSRNVVHRDLKPSNLLLQIPGYPTSLKVADFGQSKFLMPGEKTRTVCGTPGYRPPELWEKEPYDHSVDLFSSAVILFFMLAGYQPFSCYKKHQIRAKTVQCEYKADRESWQRVSEDAKSLVRSLLTKADRRIGIDAILKHKWMRGDDCAHLKYDLTENYKGLEANLEKDQILKAEKYAIAGRTTTNAPPPAALPPRLISQSSMELDASTAALSDDFVPRDARPILEHISSCVRKSDYSDYTEAVARRYCKMILDAVERLHAGNIVHRNITFPNLLVTADESIVFRGMSHATRIRSAEGEYLLTGYCGTPYRSTAPEVYTDFTYNEKVDLWSVGVAIYFLLCGVDPFNGVGIEAERIRLEVRVDFPFSDRAPSQPARELVKLLLRPHSGDRPSATEALQHRWFKMDESVLEQISLEFAYGGIVYY